MLEWLNSQDPVVQLTIMAAAALIVLALLGALLRAWREGRADAARRAQVRRTQAAVQEQLEEQERLALRIVATSSTRTIAGFAVVRQIEAVFTDNHQTPAKAVEALKAAAARKGANAIVNLDGKREANGKCSASGDAVVVKPLAPRGAAPRTPEPPGERRAGQPPPTDDAPRPD